MSEGGREGRRNGEAGEDEADEARLRLRPMLKKRECQSNDQSARFTRSEGRKEAHGAEHEKQTYEVAKLTRKTRRGRW